MAALSTFFYQSPFCALTFWATERGVCKVSFRSGKTHLGGFDFTRLKRELDLYFRGRIIFFSVPLDFEEKNFSGKVLTCLRMIPFGQTISYGLLAKEVGFPGAARAVGTVMARNEIPLLIPCHRVIRSNGSVGEFSGGAGLKAKLLRHEGRL